MQKIVEQGVPCVGKRHSLLLFVEQHLSSAVREVNCIEPKLSSLRTWNAALVTSYNLKEAEDDEDVLMAELCGARWLWEAEECTDLGDDKARESVAMGTALRDSSAWQCFIDDKQPMHSTDRTS